STVEVSGAASSGGANTIDSPRSGNRRWTRLCCRSWHRGKLEESSGRAERHCHHHKLRHRAIRLPDCGRSEELRPVPVDREKGIEEDGPVHPAGRGRGGFCREDGRLEAGG